MSHFDASKPFGSSAVADVCLYNALFIAFLVSQHARVLDFFICSSGSNVQSILLSTFIAACSIRSVGSQSVINMPSSFIRVAADDCYDILH